MEYYETVDMIHCVDMKYMTLNLKTMGHLGSKLTLVYSFWAPTSDRVIVRHYNTTLRALIPLPDLAAPPESASHLNAYPEFAAGSTVMALYPDTSCFYRAVVIESPTDMARVSLSLFYLE